MAYESLKSLAPAPGAENDEATEPTPTKAKRGRRKKESDETEIAKTQGHKLANKQRSEASEILGGLERQELILTATRGYQKGQHLAKVEEAAKIAGTVDVLADALTDRIQGLKESLRDGLENHDPLEVLDALGLKRTEEETQDFRKKIENLAGEDYSRFLL